MDLTFSDYLTVISAFILSATLIAAILQVRLLRRQIKDDHDWRRREKSIGFSQIYNPKLREVKQRITKSFGYIHSRKDPLTNKEIDDACNEDGTLRDDISYLLAYLENIALCCKHHVADFSVILDLMGNTYKGYYYQLQPVIKFSQQRNPRLWKNIEWLVHKIEDENKKRENQPAPSPKTGDV